MKAASYDIAVIGSGFAGSLLAMICHRLGRSVILIEKGRHPRFTIGESSTPLTNLLLEDLTTRYKLPALTPLAKWGTWQQAYPDIACGLKRGFSFYHHRLGRPDVDDPNRENELLVAASPNDRIADTHWYRPEFDQLFANEAAKIGIEYLDEAELRIVSELENEVTMSGSRNGKPLAVRAKFVVDATGPRGFLHRMLGLPELPMPDFPQTQALYSHFTNVGRYADQVHPCNEQPPYPIDAAAVHHVFCGGWIWVLQFNNGVTSAGVAATEEAAERLKLSDGGDAWTRLLALIPKLQNQFAGAKSSQPFTYVPQLPFRSGKLSGRRWIQLPSAAGFVDPLLSTGFALTLLGVSRLSEIIETEWDTENFSTLVRNSVAKSDQELLAASRLIGSLYASMNNFPVFVALSHLYFTAVIFSETARRLGRPELASSFLLHDHPYFGPRCLELFQRVKNTNSKLLSDDIIQAIEALNLAGLGNPKKRNWYPIDANDLFKNAYKVQATAEEIAALLERSGFSLS
jgi:FADH2 O2-dependent halogenase